MKRNSSHRSAFFILRASAAFLLCVTGLTLGFVAFAGLGGGLVHAQPRPEEDSDPDLPAFMSGKIDKEDYLERRADHTNKLRGVRRDRRGDPGARGRAIGQMNRQAGISQTSASTVAGSTSVGAFSLNSAAISSSMWTPIGPSPLPNGQTFNTNNIPVSGRTVAIAIHPTNSSIAYVGAAQGGVYRTMDGGATWTPLFDNAQTLSIGSVAIAPSQPSTIYVGTGEGNFSGDCFFGVGIYRIDNADTSSPTLTGPLNKNASNADVLSGWGIDKIIVHPTDPNTIFFGTSSGISGVSGDAINDATAASAKPRALWRSTNAASANPVFQKLTAATDNGGNLSVTDLEFEPGNPNNVLVGIRGTSVAGSGGVYRSTNALAANPTFTRTLAVGSATVLTRTEIGIAKVGAQVTVYAATTDSSGTLKRSIDGGVTWSAAISGATGFCGAQCDYDMPVAVDPTNANVVYLGGPGDGAPAHIMIKSSNALAATPTFATVQTGLHADEHSIEIDPSNTSTVWTGNDGGIFKSSNGGTSWTSLNNVGYVATQFTSLALHPTDANFTIGGTQDNGTECQGPCGTFVGNVWNQADFGDGGFAAIDQSATNLTSVNMYHTYFNQTNNLIGYAFVTTPANAKFVSNPISDSWSFSGTGGSASCATGGGYACTEAVEFYMPMAVGPGTPNPLYTGTDRLHRAPTPGASNATVSQVFATGIPISAIGISRQNDSVRIVGLDNGKVFRTLTAQTTGWPDVTGPIPAGYISRAVIDPNNQNTAYATISDYFGNSTAHVYKTTNLNAATPTWSGMDGGQIPDVPVNAFVVDPANSNFLYAGTDIGVYRSADGGSSWQPYSNGLPRVAVFDMAIQNPNRILRIATHGRGMWEIFIGATGTLTGTVTATGTNAPLGGAIVSNGSNSATTDANGVYLMSNIPVGTYSVTASADGYSSNTISGVVVSDGQVTNQNFSLATAPLTGCITDTTQADFQEGVGNTVDLVTNPGAVKLSPATPNTDAQMTTVSTTGQAITTTTWQAQTFVPTISGPLGQVDADLFCSACSGANPDITLEVRSTSGGIPTATVLASTTITGFSSGSGQFYSATFSAPANLTAGSTYALVARILTTRTGTYAWLRSSTNVYTSGAWIQSTNSGGAWVTQTTDLGFKTYISTGFAASGDLASAINDSNPAPVSFQRWTTLSWTATTPANTSLKFQAAASNNVAGPFSFVGPDGTAATFFTANGASLAQFNGKRYLKYKGYLATTSASVSPTLNDVTVCFNNTPKQNQTITFPSISDQLYGNPDIAPGATASSGLTVNVNAVGNCSIVGGNIHITGVGSCTATATQAGNDTYNAAPPVARTFNISQASSTTTVTVTNATYDGSPHSGAAIVTGAGGLSQSLAITYSGRNATTYPASSTAPTSAGDYTASATFAGDANHTGSADSKDFTIAVAASTTTVTVSNATYNGATHGGTATVTGAGGLNQSLSVTYSGRNTTTYAASTTPPTAVGDYTASAAFDGDSNHSASSDARDYSIGKGNPAISVTPYNVVYDGMSHSASGTAKGAQDESLDGLDLSGTAHTDSGDYTSDPWSFTDVTGNYNNTAGTVHDQISKASSTTTVTVAGATYDGMTHGGTAEVTGAGGLTQSLTVTYSGRNGTSYAASSTAPTNAGDYTATATFPGDANHTGSSDNKNYSISKANAVISVTEYSVTYDTAPHTATGSATGVETPAPADLTGLLHLSGTTHTGAGDYPNDPWTFEGNGNYNPASGTVHDHIDKATATIQVNPYMVTYDTASHTATGTAKGVANENLTGLSLAGTTHSDAGDYLADPWTFTNANYQDDSGTVHDQIGQASSVTTVNVGNAIYDGLPHGGNAVVLGAGGFSQSLTVSYNGRNTTTYNSTVAPINAGDYTASASYPGDANYTGSSDSKDFTIAKASPVIYWTNPANIDYGTALSATQLNAVAKIGALVIPGGYLYTPGSGAVLNAGSGQTLQVDFTPDDTANYNGATKSVLINVGQRPATVTADNKTKQFSDPLPTFTATIAGLFGADTLGGTINFATAATPLSAAGTYAIVPSGSGFNPNYAVSFANGTLTVTQEDATLTYTGDTLLTTSSNNTATVTLAAFVQEAQDGYLGNMLSGNVVKFSLYKSTNLTMATPDYTATAIIGGVNNIASKTIVLPDDGYTIKLELLPNLYYTAPYEAAAVTVVQPGTGATSGGGWLTDSNGRRANFSFNIKYLPSGNPKGHSMYIYREHLDLAAYGAPAGVRDYDVITKSTALTGLTLSNTTTPMTAAFSGKNIVLAIDRITGASYTISGGLALQFQVNVTDNGEPGSSDTYALRIWNTTGTYKAVGTYTASGINSGQAVLGGGNIQVR